MSTNDILRKYLDILKEDDDKAPSQANSEPTSEPSEPSAAPADKSSLTVAPLKGPGSIKGVIEAVKSFQSSIGMEANGVIDPKTLAEILSQSGTYGREEAEKLKAGAGQGEEEKTSEPVAEGVDPSNGSSKHDQLHDKAALHLGYAHGLLSHPHQCPHNVGTSAHSHYCEGHRKGLEECGQAWTAPQDTM